jgi:hypothetical protein
MATSQFVALREVLLESYRVGDTRYLYVWDTREKTALR